MIKKLPLVPEPMPLVKEFKNDDPTTYLSNPEQQRNMLLATVESQTPQVDEDIITYERYKNRKQDLG
jgi:hypothetical protein